jgi:DNA-binding transcriptional MerR regulator
MYSDEDIARLRMIKHLVDEIGLNLSGIKMALNLRDRILEMKEDIISSSITTGLVKQLEESLDEMLEMIGYVRSAGQTCRESPDDTVESELREV